MLNHSCEEVLKRIFEHEGPLYLVEEGEKETLPFEEKMAEFMSVSMDILQEESIPLGIGLGAVLYLYMDAFSEEKKKAGGIEIPNEGTISSLLQEFELVKNSMSKEDLENSAWEVISSVVDTFCHIIRQTNLRAKTVFYGMRRCMGCVMPSGKDMCVCFGRKIKIVRIISFLQNESCMPAILRNVCIFVMKQIFCRFCLAVHVII